MDAFEQVWQTSRSNSWSWGYPATIVCGVVLIVMLSTIRKPTLRRTLKVGAILLFGFIATDFSAREIQEKWRLRGEWAETHREQMTDAGWRALTVDGANLTLGPLIYGMQATAILAASTLVLFLIRKAATRAETITSKPGESATDFARNLPASSNPYHPPHSS